MVTDSTDGFVSNFIANDGTWEPANLKTFSRFVKKGLILVLKELYLQRKKLKNKENYTFFNLTKFLNVF